jgi:DUF4097 and DUF4098 domain-containing protein YvlB
MLMKSLITTILLSVALATNGAGPSTASGVARQELLPLGVETDPTSCVVDPGQELREEFHQTYPLSATGRVSLENLNGGVQIKVWDRAAVQVDAVKKAYRKERMAEARIEVNSTEENFRIKTQYPRENQYFRGDERRYDNPAIVEYSLIVPRRAVLESIELVNGSLDIDGAEGNVKASAVNGKLNARGLSGEAKLSTVNGTLQAAFTQLDESRAISLGSVNGNVILIIPSNANASIRAGTVHGDISSDFGLKVKHGEYVGHSMDGQLGTGGARIKLGNVNGSIKVNRAEDGLPLSPAVSLMSSATANQADAAVEAEVAGRVAAANTLAEEARVSVEVSQAFREAQREAQRQVEAALREAQKEIERAQREMSREQVRIQRVPVISRVKGKGVGAGDSYSSRFTAKETRSFSVSGVPRVTITTFDGPVTVRGWDKAEVSYTATTHAKDEESLKRLSIQAQQQGQTISVNAIHSHTDSGRVSFEVYVPRQATLHVSSGDGSLNLDGVSGEITLRSGDGPIKVLNCGGQLEVNTGDGNIQVVSFEGLVDARTGDGPIELDGNFSAVFARTGSGKILLSVPAGSSFTIETNAAREITNEGFTLIEDVTPSPRLKRFRIGNGGKVFTLKTGEGQILLRPRN